MMIKLRYDNYIGMCSLETTYLEDFNYIHST